MSHTLSARPIPLRRVRLLEFHWLSVSRYICKVVKVIAWWLVFGAGIEKNTPLKSSPYELERDTYLAGLFDGDHLAEYDVDTLDTEMSWERSDEYM